MKEEVLKRRYAQALFKLSGNLDAAAKLGGQLKRLTELVSKNEKWIEILDGETVTEEKKGLMVKEFCAVADIHKYLESCFKIMVAKKIVHLIPGLLLEYEKLLMDARGEIEVEIVVPDIEVWDLLKSQAEKVVEKISGKKVIFKCRVNRQIIGGAVLKIGNKIFDGSVRGELARLRKKLSPAKI